MLNQFSGPQNTRDQYTVHDRYTVHDQYIVAIDSTGEITEPGDTLQQQLVMVVLKRASLLDLEDHRLVSSSTTEPSSIHRQFFT